MKITDQSQLLDAATRKKIIEGFGSYENECRKKEAFKGYECLKDKTVNYVLDLLSRQFDAETVYEMQYALSNISILRKVIDKLARVYALGVTRTMPGDDAGTEQITAAADYLKMTAAMKKTNTYFRTFKNTLAYVRPISNGEGKFDVTVEVKPPFYYDVVENPDNPALPLAIVLSDYVPARQTVYSVSDAAIRSKSRDIRPVVGQNGERLMQSYQASGIVASGAGEEADEARYVWWTKDYHFTTNGNGEYVEGTEEIENPIHRMPFVNFAGEQDGQFWAEGGSDLIDAGVQINTGLTNIKHVGVSQGYGQLYMTGKDLPKSVKVGPNHCIQLVQNDKDDPTPTIGFLNAAPQLDSLKGVLEMETALMLSTNNLSTSGFAVSLSGGRDFASGIALMIDKAESIEDISEQAEVFRQREPLVFSVAKSWLDVYGERGLLTEEAEAVEMPAEPEKVLLTFVSPKPVMSEMEQLTVLEKRKDLGLNTDAEILMRDNPGMTEKEAQAKFEKIRAEREAKVSAMVEVTTNEGTENDGDERPNDDDARPNVDPETAADGS